MGQVDSIIEHAGVKGMKWRSSKKSEHKLVLTRSIKSSTLKISMSKYPKEKIQSASRLIIRLKDRKLK